LQRVATFKQQHKPQMHTIEETEDKIIVEHEFNIDDPTQLRIAVERTQDDPPSAHAVLTLACGTFQATVCVQRIDLIEMHVMLINAISYMPEANS
jgi:hypothetical protein